MEGAIDGTMKSGESLWKSLRCSDKICAILHLMQQK